MHRKDLGIRKSHASDAYAMGEFHPRHRSLTQYWQKIRRNNRILSKFYDAKVVDERDGSVKKGSMIGCIRTNRSIPRNNPNSERMFRGTKVSKGRESIRRKRSEFQPGDIVRYMGKNYTVHGSHCNGTRVILDNKKSVSVKGIISITKKGGWQFPQSPGG